MTSQRSPDDTPPPRNRPQSALLAEALEATPPPRTPALGDDLFGFKLTEELGHGSFARVYLATQKSLAGRFVAVKVTNRPTREPDKLARLQHTNIVPVYSVHETDSVQVICMPFVGRRTLSHLLGEFRRDHPSRQFPSRRAATVKPGSTTVHGSSGSATAASSGIFRVPTTAPGGVAVPLIGDVTAVLKAILALASGLSHAHGRGILHLDIKPANVLFADTGEMMLLDFNLAYDTTLTGREMVGGTVQYMAPEQLLDIRSRGQGGVDARTDLYSLGVLAYEMLTGSVPFPPGALANFDDLMAERHQPVVPASEVNPAVTPAVDAILKKLLAADPAARYQSADDLREDLRRQLADEPLLFAANPSVRERAAKWRRRHPGAAGRIVAACMIGLAVAGAVIADGQAAARAAADAVVQSRDARAALPVMRLDLVLTDDPQKTARGHKTAGEWLTKYGLPDDADWRKRDSFARLSAEAQSQVSQDLGELLLLRAHAAWRSGKLLPEGDARREAAAEALKWNRTARRCFPDDAVPVFLRKQFTELATATGELDSTAPEEETAKPRNAREFFLAAVTDFAAARFSAAVPHLESAILGQPDHAAAQFLLAVCRHHLGQHQRAIERYDAARVLIPTDPRPFFYRGVTYAVTGKPAAVDEFTKAIDLDPEYREAYRNRALAWRAGGKLAEAETDLTKGLSLDGPPYQFHLLRARVRTERRNPTGAAEDMKAIADMKPEGEMDFLVRGWTRIDRTPADALADFRAAEVRNPQSVQALQNQIHILSDRLGKVPEALEVATKLKQTFPDYAAGSACRAVLLARLGKRDEALKEAEHARALSDEAAITYRLACVHALTGKGHADDLPKALELLRKAFQDGYRNTAEYETDADLDELRKLPEFAPFLRAAKEVGR